jgi:hypothetical protein
LVRRFVAKHGQVSKQLVVISSIPEGLSGFWRTEVAASPVPFLNDLSALAALRSLTAPPAPAAWPPPAGDVEAVASLRGLEPRALDVLAQGTGLLTEVEAYRLLEVAGIPVAPYALVASRDEAIAAAARLGYPVALKVCAPGVAHKPAAGLVRLGLSSAAAVACAYDELVARPGPPWAQQPPVLVQAMADGVELLLGMRVDPQFGPVVVIGLGGAWAETLRDVQTGLAPMAPEHAEALIDRLRIAPMLRERAVRAELDIHALAGVVSRFSYLAIWLAPYLASLEINPLIVSGRGCVAVDALGQVRGKLLRDWHNTVE